MRTISKRRGLVASVAALALVPMALTVDAGAQTGPVQAAPFTVWNTIGANALDGAGSLLAAANLPTASGTQTGANAWSYAHVVGFTGDEEALASISLDTDRQARTASIVLDSGTEVVEGERFPFEWQVGRYYLPLVYLLPGSALAGFVFDFTTQAWTYVGTVRVPASYGRLSSQSITLLAWHDDPLADCLDYPITDHFRYAPYGLVNGDPALKNSVAAGNGVTEGDCGAFVTDEPAAGFRRYRAGSPTGNTTTTSSNTTSTTSLPS